MMNFRLEIKPNMTNLAEDHTVLGSSLCQYTIIQLYN